jgi:hypothetical protein
VFAHSTLLTRPGERLLASSCRCEWHCVGHGATGKADFPVRVADGGCHCADRLVAYNGVVSALRLFFTVTLDRPDLSRRLVLARFPRKLPAVLSVEEVVAGSLLKRRGCATTSLFPTSIGPASSTQGAREFASELGE